MTDSSRGSPAPSGTARTCWFVCALALAVFVWHASTVRPGHTWWGMDDYTAYLQHGRNLLSGRAYTDIDTVFDPGLPPSYERTAFPPSFSLVVGLLEHVYGHPPAPDEVVVPPSAAPGRAPDVVVKRPAALPPGGGADLADPLRGTGGFDLVGVKRVLALFTALSVWAAWRALRHGAGGAVLLLAVAAYALSPYVFAIRELVRSEMLYLALLFLWMDQVECLRRREQAGERVLGRTVAAALLLVLAYSTRTMAVVMPPALVVADLLRDRRLRRSTWLMLGLALGGILLQRALFADVEGGYLDKATREWHFGTLLVNAQQLFWNYERLWENGVSDLLRQAMTFGTLALALIGLVARLFPLRRVALLDVFVLGHLLLILLLPTDSAWMRYLLPVLPALLLYIFGGAALLAAGVARRRTLLLGGTALAVGISYAGAVAQLDSGPLPDGLAHPSTLEVFDWIATHSEPDDVIVFNKWRAVTHATGRPSLCYPQEYRYGPLDDAALWRHFEAVRPRYFVLKHTPATESNLFSMLSHSDDRFLVGTAGSPGFVAKYAERFVERFRGGEFVIYELKP